ncbi:hypothetical protein Dda_3652 [Drechslerella dactyloides]|uniref:Uncharacterized protein n=1 Tax=Drechslerella dactyloides TaxID=74499 RepID=A0AAD6IZ58_DREDA|nr:hypothetical protein Dda_3652 [Drechslerella dactyloides]
MPPSMSISTAGFGLRLLRRPPSIPLSCASATIRPATLIRLAPRRCYAAKPARRTPAPSSPSGGRYFSLEENLARAGHETVLYQSGSRLLIYAYYTISVASVSWAGMEFYENVICQPDAPSWTRAISSVSAGMGLLICAYTFWVPSRTVHRIVAVPKSARAISLQIQTRSLLPFRRRIIDSTPQSTWLVTPFVQTAKVVDQWKFTGYFGPLKYIAWLAVSSIRKLVRALRMDDFAKLKIGGGSGLVYRIDREGWAWERERRGLDMLLKKETKYYPTDGGRM